MYFRMVIILKGKILLYNARNLKYSLKIPIFHDVFQGIMIDGKYLMRAVNGNCSFVLATRVFFCPNQD